MNFTKDKSDLMGIFLLILGLLLFAFLIGIVIKKPFISNDEWYTMGMMQLPLHNIIKVTAGDVHPPMFYIILYGFMSFFKLLSIDIDLIYIMTQGGPLNSTNVLVYAIYKNAFEYFNVGTASATAYILFAIIFVLTLFQWKLRKRFVYKNCF